MKRIPECDNCPSDGRCQYQDLEDCQCCKYNINESPVY